MPNGDRPYNATPHCAASKRASGRRSAAALFATWRVRCRVLRGCPRGTVRSAARANAGSPSAVARCRHQADHVALPACPPARTHPSGPCRYRASRAPGMSSGTWSSTHASSKSRLPRHRDVPSSPPRRTRGCVRRRGRAESRAPPRALATQSARAPAPSAARAQSHRPVPVAVGLHDRPQLGPLEHAQERARVTAGWRRGRSSGRTASDRIVRSEVPRKLRDVAAAERFAVGCDPRRVKLAPPSGRLGRDEQARPQAREAPRPSAGRRDGLHPSPGLGARTS